MTFENFTDDELAAEMATRRAAAAQASGDAATTAAVNARHGLSSGGTGDVPAAGPHPMELAKAAISDAIYNKHQSREQAVALGIAQVMSAAARGDDRVRYRGRVEPGV